MAKLTKGDPVLVVWMDIQEDSGKSPDDADLWTWQTLGFWIGSVRKRNISCVVISHNRGHEGDKRTEEQDGYLCIPRSCVKRVFRLKITDEVKLR